MALGLGRNDERLDGDQQRAVVASAVGWLDQSEEQQRKMREIIALFAETGTIDDIGIGAVRDAFSEVLFPGLSTVQTRVRYLLFVPWVYQRLEFERVASRRADEQARQWEIALIYSLLNGGGKEGVIGSEAKDTLKQLPSFIYWGGLRSFGIRTFTGTRSEYFRSMDRFNSAAPTRGAEVGDAQFDQRARWHTNVPEPPENLWDEATLDLTGEEARYLQERMLASHPESLLAHLVRSPVNVPNDSQFPWDTVDADTLQPDLATKLGFARYFSEAIHGASLLYNLMLAEASQKRSLPGADDRVNGYQDRLAAWTGEMKARAGAIEAVDRTEFWQVVLGSGVNVAWPVQRFINLWLNAVGAGADVVNSDELRTAISDRERQLKKSLARLANPHALEMWRGDAGVARFDFRWRVGRSAVNDIATGLQAA